jgi:hypothetical protein
MALEVPGDVVYEEPNGTPHSSGGHGPACSGEGCGQCGPNGGWCGWGYGLGWLQDPCWQPFQDRLWVRGQYLLWSAKGDELPPLVTAGTAQGAGGVLFGDSAVNNEARSGALIGLGYWLDPCQTYGIEASCLILGIHTTDFRADNQTNAILARPYTDVSPNAQTHGATRLLIASPGVIQGSVTASVSSDFQAVDVLFRQALCQPCNYRIDALVGYRFCRLDEDLAISTSTRRLVAPRTRQTMSDSFHALNEFNGAELGVAAEWRGCRWSLEVLMKMALGDTSSHVQIAGSTVTTAPTAQTYSTGLLAQRTNIGQYREDQLTMVPELGVALGYELTCRLRATFGYTFLYWSKVARPGDQIDLDLNSSQFQGGTLTGAARPAFSLVGTDYWAQGVRFGLDYRF